MRLDKLLSNMGYGSRKEVKILLKSKAVEVNGVFAKDVSMHVDSNTDQIIVFGEKVIYTEYIY